MKLLPFFLLLLPVFGICEPDVLAKYVITDARYNDIDATKEYLDQGGYLVFYENDYENLSMANIRSIAQTQSYGRIYNAEFFSEKATSETYETELLEFVWSYANSYDTKEGTAKVQLVKVYKPQGTIFKMTMILENLDVLVYKGYIEGSVNFKKRTKATAQMTTHTKEVNNALPIAEEIHQDFSQEHPHNTTDNSSTTLTSNNFNGCEKISLSVENLLTLVEYSISDFGTTLTQYDYVKSSNQTRVGQYTDGKYTTSCKTSLVDRFDDQAGQHVIYLSNEQSLIRPFEEELIALEEHFIGVKNGFQQYAFTYQNNSYLLAVKQGENQVVRITK